MIAPTMSPAARLAALLCVVCWAVPVHATGQHNKLPALVTSSPQLPSDGVPWRVRVSFESVDPAAVHPARRVRLVADMTGHAMAPVEAELARADQAGNVYVGTLAFTMRGPWRVTLRVEELTELFEGNLAVEVVGDEASSGLPSTRQTIVLERPDRPTIVPPAWTLGGTVILVLSLQWIVARVQHRRYRGTTATSA